MQIPFLQSVLEESLTYLRPEPILENLQTGREVTFNVHAGEFPVLVASVSDASELSAALMNAYTAFRSIFEATFGIDTIASEQALPENVRKIVVGALARNFLAQALSVFDNSATVLIQAHAKQIRRLQVEERAYLSAMCSEPSFLYLLNWAELYPDSCKEIIGKRIYGLLRICEWLRDVPKARTIIDGGLATDVEFQNDWVLLRFYSFARAGHAQEFSTAQVIPVTFIGDSDRLDFRMYGGILLGCQLVIADAFSQKCLQTLALKRQDSHHLGFGHNDALRWVRYAKDHLSQRTTV